MRTPRPAISSWRPAVSISAAQAIDTSIELAETSLLRRLPSWSCVAGEKRIVQAFGNSRPRRIFFASLSGISRCRGIASTAPFAGFVHRL